MINVFVIDDSMLVRNSIANMLKMEEGIKIIGEAPNPVDAIKIFKKVGFPDVFILDIEMPKMDGLSFLEKIYLQNPTPVIICSTLVSLGSSTAIDALRFGAVEIIHKPTSGVKEFFFEQKEEFILKIKAAARSKTIFNMSAIKSKKVSQEDVKVGEPSTKFVAIGSSTGGVQVIEEILLGLKEGHQGIVITQHMPVGFTASFATRLDNLTSSKVIEASNGEVIANNKVIIAKGGIHMEVYEDGGIYKVRLKDYPKVNSHKPSVNVLFKSISKVSRKNITAFILTGMGDDGAKGLKLLRELGNNTYSQEKKSCVVYGMPHVATEIGASMKELSIQEIIEKINAI